MPQQPQPVKRSLSLDNILTFADLGYFEPYTNNIKQVIMYTKRLEAENKYYRDLLDTQQDVGVEEVTPEEE